VRQLYPENNVNPKVQCFTRKACSASLLFHSDALPELSQATAWFFFEKLREWPFGPPIGGPIGHFSIALDFLILLRKPVGAQALKCLCANYFLKTRTTPKFNAIEKAGFPF